MSRIGKQPVPIPDGVTVDVKDSRVSAKGPQGEQGLDLPPGISASVADGRLELTRTDDTRQSKSLHGLARSLAANLLEGVSKGFKKELELQGVGFRAAVQGQKLTLSLGFASPVEFMVPDGVAVSEEGGTRILLTSPDKQRVGDAAARIRSFFPAEPYKGKGVRYRDERVRRKVGKTVA